MHLCFAIWVEIGNEVDEIVRQVSAAVHIQEIGSVRLYHVNLFKSKATKQGSLPIPKWEETWGAYSLLQW